jgi:hypothetical protein
VHAGRNPQHFNRLWLAASGSPFWRGFPPPRGWLLPLVYRFLPWIARQGVLHGRRLGFGGTEARGLIADWARVGLNNHYAAAGMDEDLDAQMARVHGSAQAVLMERLVGTDRIDAGVAGEAAECGRAAARAVRAGTGHARRSFRLAEGPGRRG